MASANFSLDKFTTQIKGGGLARTNRFEVFITPPAGLGGTRSSYNSELVSLYCEQASLPSLNISSKSFKIFGPTYQRPMTSEYGGEGIALNFHVDREMKVKEFFEDWMHLIIDKNNFTVGFQKNYISTISIKQLDEEDNVNYEIELSEAFPRNLNPMELNHSSQNQTHRLNVVFAYRSWRRIEQSNPVNIPEQIQYPEVSRTDTSDFRNATYNPNRINSEGQETGNVVDLGIGGAGDEGNVG